MRTLLVLNLAGLRYGVWEDEVRSVREVDTVHRLPLVPACIAGMAIIDDRTVTLADLSVCIGLPPTPHAGKARLLVMSEDEKVAGFLVSGDIEKINVSDEYVFRMPRYLSTLAVDTCVEHHGAIPVINVSALFSRVMKADREPPAPEFGVSQQAEADISSISHLRVFECAGERFASSGGGLAPEPAAAPEIARLSLMPAYVSGVGLYEKTAVPLISLAKRMGLPKSGPERAVIIADIGDERFGFLVDADMGMLSNRDFLLRALPPIAACGWMTTAAVANGHILPIIGLGRLIGARIEEKPLPERYSPDSDFQQRFGRQDVDVVEFLLLGSRHALPKSEIIDVYPLRPYRSVPNAQPIVAGVAEHDAELLPVLDLAAVFGRRSFVVPGWSMLLVKNGDFKAFVLTEGYFGVRRLLQEAHRAVPMVLPHSVVYGCYPDGYSVRLILNVHALGVHFDRTLVKGFLGALSQEMEQAPSELLPELLPEDYAPERDAAGEGYAPSAVAGHVPQAAVEEHAVTSPGRLEMSETEEDVSKKARIEAEQAVLEEERRRQEMEEKARIEALERARLEQERARQEAAERERIEAERARAESEAERMRAELEKKAREEERLRLEQERLQKEEEEKARLEEDRAKEADSLHAGEGAKGQKVGPEDRTAVETAKIIKEAEEIIRTERLLKEEPPAGIARAHQSSPDRATGTCRRMDEAEPRPSLLKSFAYIALVAAVIGSIFYIIFKGSSIEKKTETAVEAGGQKSRGMGGAEPKEEPLVLIVPKDAETVEEVYIVKKGDTLWHISKRFTGNPFNYPRVARDNRIANPDLIFPHQKIRIIKER